MPSSPKEVWLRFSVELYQIAKIASIMSYSRSIQGQSMVDEEEYFQVYLRKRELVVLFSFWIYLS